MAWPVIEKSLRPGEPEPNLRDYPATRAHFDWDDARRELARPPRGELNMAWQCVGRHAQGPLRDRQALRWLGKSGQLQHLTYAQLDAASSRFANVLGTLGVKRGEAVFSLCGRRPELFVAALGTLANGSVFSPLFSAFGPEPIRARLEKGRARLLVTTPSLYLKKVAPIRAQLPLLEQVLVFGEPDGAPPAGTRRLEPLLDAASPEHELAATGPEDPALLHFTSGTTGEPKGALHVHGAVLMHEVTGRSALDLHPDDIFWCTADPGWVTGMSYGILAPLACGVTSVVDEAEFDAERWYRILAQQQVTVWYTAPTAIRMLMKAGAELPKRFDLSRLRFIGSVGEPLNPEAVLWGAEALGRPIHDNWWQTETGGIMVANYASMPIKPGSMGKPLPGVEAAVVRRRDGHVELLADPDQVGELALRSGWPSMFRGYLGQEARYKSCFAEGWYLSGDLVRRDADGYFWFVGRSDDVIKSSGHLIGPFEVESVLMEHPGVLEAAAIGKPDPIAMEVVKAFVVPRRGVTPSESLRLDILGFARQRLGPVVAPKELEFAEDLPKTRSGKIMRRLLKARELGLPPGDLSMLEGAS